MKERNSRVTSEARAHPRTGDDAETVRVADPRDETLEDARVPEDGVPTEDAAAQDTPDDTVDEDTVDEDTVDETLDEPAGKRARRRRRGRAVADDDGADEAEDADTDEDDGVGGGRRRLRGGRLSVPLVPTLAVLLVLLLAGTGFLWFTRPAPSSVQTGDYVQVLEAARSGVVDLTSFDYLTIDEDIAQIKKISVGDLQKESVNQLNTKRQDLTDQQAVVNTRVIGAAVTRANGSNGTALLVIESTQKTKASAQPQVVRYRIQVQLEKVSGRWRLSGISGR
jgi:Mce-associated membrane protein